MESKNSVSGGFWEERYITTDVRLMGIDRAIPLARDTKYKAALQEAFTAGVRGAGA
jgi:hypothetical protein